MDSTPGEVPGVAGWVKNEPDGRVTAVILGSDASLSAMIELLGNGPRFASVSTVESEPTELNGDPVEFQILR